MLLNYKILSRVKFNHSYFADGLANGIVISPSKETQLLCKKLDLIARIKQNEIHLLAAVDADNETSEIELSNKLKDNFNLTFYIQPSDPNWNNFTNLDLTIDQTLFFSNIDGTDHNGTIHLHKNETVTEDNVIQTVQTLYELEGFDLKKPDLFKIGSEKMDETHNYAFETQEKLIKPIAAEDKEKYEAVIYLNPNKLDEGLYEIRENEKLVQRVFVQKDNIQHYAICHLTVSDSLGSPRSLITAGALIEPLNLEVSFSNRLTYWRYLMPVDQLKQFEGLMVTNGQEKDSFNPKTEMTIQNGKAMYCFTSKEELELKEKANRKFQLKKNVGIDNRSEGIIINYLPIPQKESLYRLDENGNRFSDIYIYI